MPYQDHAATTWWRLWEYRQITQAGGQFWQDPTC